MNDNSIASGVKQLFNHREQRIIIGLTGRTGSGCTTLSQILGRKDFSELNLRLPKIPPGNHEDRKYRVVHDWISTNWRPFVRISASELLCGFIANSGFQDFRNYVIGLARSSQKYANADLRSLEELERKFENIGLLSTGIDLWSVTDPGPPDTARSLTFVFDCLPDFAKALRKALADVSPGLDSLFFQTVGDNIRRSGEPYQGNTKADTLFTIARTVEKVIDMVLARNQTEGQPTYITIDAIRHPYEARYFQERYSYFYLLAVNTPNEQRIRRLSQQQFRGDEIKRLDDKEYPQQMKKGRPEGYDLLVSQDLQSTIENADIYVVNADDLSSPSSPHQMKEQVLRYVSLMMHPGLVTPTSIERCMQSAFAAKLSSGCISRQVGAVVADQNFSVKAIGWNDVPRGQVPCSLRNVKHLFSAQDPAAFSTYEDSAEFKGHLSGQPISLVREHNHEGRNLAYCFKSNYNDLKGEKNQVHTRSLHAEENAFLQLTRGSGQSVENGNLFTTASPCELCAKKAFQLGIKNIFFIDPYPGISNEHVLASGIEQSRPKLVQFTGAVGRTYHQLFSPIMPMKDELKMLLG